MGSKQSSPSNFHNGDPYQPQQNTNTNTNIRSNYFDFTSKQRKPNTENIDLSVNLNIPPPIHPRDDRDSAKIYGFYFSRNLCWIWGLIFVLVFCAILAAVMDSGLTTSWSSQGSLMLNDRHVEVSSVHTCSLSLSRAPSFEIARNGSTSSTPAIWDGRVYFTTYDGYVVATDQHSGDILWEVNICKDVYNILPIDCPGYVQVKKYISVATPTVWGGNLVISVNKPADILVIRQNSGEFLYKATLDVNPRAQLTQSPTVVGNSLYIGTSISDEDAIADGDGDCSFTGKILRWDLEDMQAVCTLDLGGTQTDFTGMRIAGSSPPVSLKHGLVAFSVGPAICTPSWYQSCLVVDTLNETQFNYENYRSEYEDCHIKASAKNAHFNSVLVMRTDDCSIVWSEKLLRYSAWSKACLSTNPNNALNPCGENVDHVEECDFYHNSYANCPSEFQSASNNYDWSDDPVLKSDTVMAQEYLFVAQQSGIIYKFNLNEIVGDEILKSHVEWATSVSQGEGIGGLALKKDTLFFSFYNQAQRPWIYDDTANTTSLCGGWGALNIQNGLPKWYRTHPMCNQTFYEAGAVCEFGEVLPNYAGSRSAPSITNNLVFVTSSDTNGADESGDHKGGHVYALRVKDGSVASDFEFKRPFGKQGFSIHGRCVYAGNGLSSEDGSSTSDKTHLKFVGWCAKHAYNDQHICPDLS